MRKPTLRQIRDHWSTRLGVEFPLNQCWCCGKICLLSRAHLKARMDGGSWDASNLVIACRNCNNWVDIEYQKRGEVGIVEWILAPFQQGKHRAPASWLELAWQQYDPAVPFHDLPGLADRAFVVLSHMRSDFQFKRRHHAKDES